MKKQNGIILAAAACLMLAGCTKKAGMSAVSVNYASQDHVEDAYKLYESLGSAIRTQMDNGWTDVSPSSFGLPSIFAEEGYELLLNTEDLDGNGYQEFTVGLKTEEGERIYLFYTVSEDGVIQKVFVSCDGSYMVKEGAFYAVYQEDGTIPGTEEEETGSEETVEEAAEQESYEETSEEETSEEEYTESEEEISEEYTEEEEYTESEEETLSDEEIQAMIDSLRNPESAAAATAPATIEEAEISTEEGYLPAGIYKYENGVMTAQ